MQSRKVVINGQKLQLFVNSTFSISKKFEEFVIQISLKLVLVNWRVFFCRIAVPCVNYNLNVTELFVSPVLNLLIFYSLIWFIILVKKFIYFLFLYLLAFPLWVHKFFDFMVDKSFILYVRKDHVFSGLFSETFGCLWSWENFSEPLFALRSDPSTPAGWVGYSFIEVRFGRLNELPLRIFNGIFLKWKQRLRCWVKIVRIVQVL